MTPQEETIPQGETVTIPQQEIIPEEEPETVVIPDSQSETPAEASPAPEQIPDTAELIGHKPEGYVVVDGSIVADPTLANPGVNSATMQN